MHRWDIEPPEARRPVQGKLLNRARIPRRFWTATLEVMALGPLTKEAKDAYVSYLDRLDENLKTGRGLILHGEIGSGKTAAACLTLIDVLARSSNRVFYVEMQRIDWMARHRDETDENGVPHWDVVTEAPFVVLDDYGNERTAEWNDVWFEEVVRVRYNALVPTIITTNLPIKKLYERQPWIEGIAREAFEHIEFTGSYRT